MLRSSAGVPVVAIGLLVSAGAARPAPAAPPFTVKLQVETRRPAPGVPWRYSVRAVDRRGRATQGTAIVQVLVRGRVVDTVGWFGFKGTLRRTYKWSLKLRGSAAVFRAKVVATGGTRIAALSVTVRKSLPKPRLPARGAPKFRATLAGETSRPYFDAAWHYVVRAVNSKGGPVAGTAVVRVLRGGRVADTVGWFGFKGTLRRVYRWAPDFSGARAVLQVIVVGPGGTRTVSFAVRVR